MRAVDTSDDKILYFLLQKSLIKISSNLKILSFCGHPISVLLIMCVIKSNMRVESRNSIT